MEGLQRSTSTFRRSGSSGLVWDERVISGELNQIEGGELDGDKREGRKLKELRVSQSMPPANRRHTRDVPTGEEPPSPRIGCFFCAPFKHRDSNKHQRRRR